MQADMSAGGNGYRLPLSPSSSDAAFTGSSDAAFTESSPSKAKTTKSILAGSRTLDKAIDRLLDELDAQERKVQQARKGVSAVATNIRIWQPSVRREDEVLPSMAHGEE